MSNISDLEQKYDIHKAYCDRINQLYRSKNTDYNDSFGKGIDSMGYASAIVRMEDKMNRIKSLLLNIPGKARVDEPIEDTLIDLANYSLMLLTEYEVRKDSDESKT